MMQLLNNFAAACATKGLQIIPPWYKYLDGSTDPDGRCTIQDFKPDDLGKVLLALFEIIIRVGALVAVGYVIYGGVQYMISQGEPDKTKGARTTILNAVIGLVIATLATAVVNFVGGRLTGA